jgi:hypothetical protein
MIETQFNIKDQVLIDGDKTLIAVITAIQWRSEQQINYECSWFANGKIEYAVIEGWRLTLYLPEKAT